MMLGLGEGLCGKIVSFGAPRLRLTLPASKANDPKPYLRVIGKGWLYLGCSQNSAKGKTGDYIGEHYRAFWGIY